MNGTTSLDKVVVTNTVTLNGGDAAILETLLQELRRMSPGVSVIICDSDAEAAAELLPGEDFRQIFFKRFLMPVRTGRLARVIARLKRLRIEYAVRLMMGRLSTIGLLLLLKEERRYLAMLRSADLVVSTGGTYLVPRYSLWPRLLEIELAAAAGTPFVLLTQSLGPFPPSVRRRASRVLKNAGLLMVRDAASARHLAQLGVPESLISTYPDVVFANARVVEAPRQLSSDLRIAISVRPWLTGAATGTAYLRAIAAAVEWLVNDRSAKVDFLSTCQGTSYWADDSVIASEVYDLLSPSARTNVTVMPERFSTDRLLDLYGTYDAVIATRMHAGILALCAGTPVLPIAYEFKTVELFTSMGLGEWVADINELEATQFVAHVDRFLVHLDAVRAEVHLRVPVMAELARRSVSELLRTL